jgi:hypothetical protein
MSSNVQVEQIKILTRMKITGKKGEQKEQLAIEIKILNKSRTVNYNIIASIRRLFFDSVSRTLYIVLSDNEKIYQELLTKISDKIPKKMIVSTETWYPPLMTLHPGESRIVKVFVPLVIARLRFNVPPPHNIEVSNISNLKQIECIVSYDPAPLSKRPKKQVPLESWQVVRKLTAARLPEKVSNT